MKSFCIQKHDLQKALQSPMSSSGFTLIEITIAMVLSALLLSIIYWTYFSINKSIESASENQDVLETGRILSEIIRKDIRCICLSGYPIVVKNEELEDFTLGHIEFVTFTGSSNNQTVQRRIGYTLALDNANSRKVLIKRESTDFSNLLDDNSKVFEVSRIVRSFRIELFNGTDWVTQWKADSHESLPKQIKVIFEILDTKGNAKKFIADEYIKSV
jgi:prepilin-type N-terminal cleavage/methylation domain-containing protein